MSDLIEFTRNYSDLSTNQGFQFEFYCNLCGTGYRTPFKPSMLGSVSGAMDTASSLFGGIFGKAADVSERARSASWEKEHDQAFQKAMNDLRPAFAQCPKCNNWVCRKKCWNAARGLCKECAPDIGVEMAAAQAEKAVQAVQEKAEASDEDLKAISKEGAWKQTLTASCPNCHAPIAKNIKFCPECGAKIQTQAFCSACGAKLLPNAKFCAECGAKTS